MTAIVKAEGLSRSFDVREGMLGRVRQVFAVRDAHFDLRQARASGVVTREIDDNRREVCRENVAAWTHLARNVECLVAG